MAEVEVSFRYARALFDAARGQNQDGAVRDELHRFARLFQSDRELAVLLNHPMVSVQVKIQYAEHKMAKPFSEMFKRFIHLVLEKKRLGALSHILAVFDDVYFEANNVLRAHLQSAFPLPQDQIKNIEALLAKTWGKQMMLETSVNEELLGGLILRLGDKLWDRSLRGGLGRLKDTLYKSSRN